MPYSLLLPRSADFTQLFDVLKARFISSLDRILLLSVMQMQWDRAEPSGYAPYIERPLPGTPAHTVLMHYALGDAQVSYLGAYGMARTVGARMFPRNVLAGNDTLFGFTETAEPSRSSMVVGYDFAAPPVPPIDLPPDKGTDTHEKPRRDARAQQQMHDFFETGVIADTCGGRGCRPPP